VVLQRWMKPNQNLILLYKKGNVLIHIIGKYIMHKKYKFSSMAALFLTLCGNADAETQLAGLKTPDTVSGDITYNSVRMDKSTFLNHVLSATKTPYVILSDMAHTNQTIADFLNSTELVNAAVNNDWGCLAIERRKEGYYGYNN